MVFFLETLEEQDVFVKHNCHRYCQFKRCQKKSNFKYKMFSTNNNILLQGIALRNTKTLALTVEDLLESIRITSPSSVAH